MRGSARPTGAGGFRVRISEQAAGVLATPSYLRLWFAGGIGNAMRWLELLVAVIFHLRGHPIQAAVDDRMSGRVMALYGMIFRAGPAVGAVLMGTLSEYLGLRLALALGAIVSGSFWLATRFRHKSMAAGLECTPIGATEGHPCRSAQH